MSTESVVKAMIQKRITDNKSKDAAYEEVIAIINKGVVELNSQIEALKKTLETKQEPEEYVDRRLQPFLIQIELQMYLLHAARQLKSDGWMP